VENPPEDVRSLGAMESTAHFLPDEERRNALESRWWRGYLHI